MARWVLQVSVGCGWVVTVNNEQIRVVSFNLMIMYCACLN